MIMKIFNNGFIELVDSMGSDLRTANCARVSFDICKFDFDGKDEKLIQYLARNKHWSPFRHVQFTFQCTLPEIVTRQFYKHVVGIAYSEHGTREIDHAWNEVSGRYIEATKLGFWIPDPLRLQSPSNKQGSIPDLGGILGPNLIQDMVDHNERSEALYNKLIAAGVAKELARSVLTTSFNTKFIWTCSLQALINFIKLRLHVHAQKEIQMVAEVLLELAHPICPISIDALLSDSP